MTVPAVPANKPHTENPESEGWWTEYGGRLDVSSGVVFIPQGNTVPLCPFPCSGAEPDL